MVAESEDLLVCLRSYGFKAQNASSWEEKFAEPQSFLQLIVEGHAEVAEHTMYSVECCLGAAATGEPLRWQASWRLIQLRKFLHDPVKASLGPAYAQHFFRAPFAHKGGLPGTTQRLNAWFKALATGINRRQFPPGLVWLTLSFLQIPEPPASWRAPEDIKQAGQRAGGYPKVGVSGSEKAGEDVLQTSPSQDTASEKLPTASTQASLGSRMEHALSEDESNVQVSICKPADIVGISGRSSAVDSEQSWLPWCSSACSSVNSRPSCDGEDEPDSPSLVLSKAQHKPSSAFRGEPVWLHIYSVGNHWGVEFANDWMRQAGTGAFHAGVEVYGREWSFGFRHDDGSGVHWCSPRCNYSHTYRESISMGGTEFSDVAVHEILTRCIPQWPGRSYHLLKRNCCHFANFLCEALKVGAVPDYVMNLASAGASIASGLDTSAEVVRGMAAAVDERYQITNSIEGFVPREIEVDEEAIETMIRNFWKSLGWTR